MMFYKTKTILYFGTFKLSYANAVFLQIDKYLFSLVTTENSNFLYINNVLKEFTI